MVRITAKLGSLHDDFGTGAGAGVDTGISLDYFMTCSHNGVYAG